MRASVQRARSSMCVYACLLSAALWYIWQCSQSLATVTSWRHSCSPSAPVALVGGLRACCAARVQRTPGACCSRAGGARVGQAQALQAQTGRLSAGRACTLMPARACSARAQKSKPEGIGQRRWLFGHSLAWRSASALLMRTSLSQPPHCNSRRLSTEIKSRFALASAHSSARHCGHLGGCRACSSPARACMCLSLAARARMRLPRHCARMCVLQSRSARSCACTIALRAHVCAAVSQRAHACACT